MSKNKLGSTKEFLEYISQERKAGKSDTEIANSLGITKRALHSKIYRITRRGQVSFEPGGSPETRDLKRAIGGGINPPPSSESQDRKTETTTGNSKVVEGTVKRIKTIEDAIEAFEIDLEEWVIDKVVINKWEVGAKVAKRHLIWENGQIVEGELDDPGELKVEPLYQVKIWLSKKKPEPITPIIGPVKISITRLEGREDSREKGELERALIIPDIQAGYRRDLRTGVLDPFHDRGALEVVLQVAQKNHFDRVIYLGDLIDLPDWSDKFIRSPEMYFTTQAAIVELSWWLGQIRLALPGAKHEAIEGNHENRLPQALMVHLSAAYALSPARELAMPPALSIERLLGLRELEIGWIAPYPDADVWLTDNLRIIHGDTARGVPGDTAKAVCQKSPVSVVFGHIHRIETASRTEYTRGEVRTIQALSPGCLCRIDAVVPGHKKGQNWQQGFGVVEYNQAGYQSLQAIPIREGLASFEGKIYQARGMVGELREDTGFAF